MNSNKDWKNELNMKFLCLDESNMDGQSRMDFAGAVRDLTWN